MTGTSNQTSLTPFARFHSDTPTAATVATRISDSMPGTPERRPRQPRRWNAPPE